jgi:peptidoglycan/xylan/chitin deacetylase (PgdA/CDA1 family)
VGIVFHDTASVLFGVAGLQVIDAAAGWNTNRNRTQTRSRLTSRALYSYTRHCLTLGGGVATGTLLQPLSSWPDGRKVAVWVTLNVECFAPGRPGPSIQPHLAHGDDIANYGWREYGNRRGFWRLLDLFEDSGTPVTAALNGGLCHSHPDVVRAVADVGWPVIAHGLDNSTPHYGLARADELKRITSTVALIEDAVGRRPLGWLTPGFYVTKATDELVHEAGLCYTADRCDDDSPYWLDVPTGRLLAMPYTLETNDITLLLSLGHTADQFARAVLAHVVQLCAEPAAAAVVGIGLHTFLVGQPGRLASLRDCLRALAAIPEVWLCTGDQIYATVTGGSHSR